MSPPERDRGCSTPRTDSSRHWASAAARSAGAARIASLLSWSPLLIVGGYVRMFWWVLRVLVRVGSVSGYVVKYVTPNLYRKTSSRLKHQLSPTESNPII